MKYSLSEYKVIINIIQIYNRIGGCTYSLRNQISEVFFNKRNYSSTSTSSISYSIFSSSSGSS